ncbi:MAG: hypothetical protein GF344_07305 [Chitinivibrionales bacterium]|nr:hypothetical protein [Chitinivibrionales bacterium]MBD3356716.1 hypothetical protein [Chitinivibrionales bacterium]
MYDDVNSKTVGERTQRERLWNDNLSAYLCDTSARLERQKDGKYNGRNAWTIMSL